MKETGVVEAASEFHHRGHDTRKKETAHVSMVFTTLNLSPVKFFIFTKNRSINKYSHFSLKTKWESTSEILKAKMDNPLREKN